MREKDPTLGSRMKKTLAALSVVASAISMAGVAAAADFGTVKCQSAIIPAYFYPGTEWDKTLDTLKKGEMAIFNPASGVGEKVNPDYVRLTETAREKGLDLIGYVYVQYGRRDISSVKREIDSYYEWYKTSSIFIDGVSSDKDDIAYYKELSDYIKLKGGKVVLNPGTVPDEEYIAIADLVIVTEGKYADYKDRKFPDWMSKYPASKFGHLVYETPKDSLPSALDLAKNANAGFVYMTDDGGDNPWDSLPKYWQEEIRTKCPSYDYGEPKEDPQADIQTKAVEWAKWMEKIFADIIAFFRNLFMTIGGK